MMKRVIRHGVFETNSSSSHSISIAAGDYVADRLPLDDAGVCHVYPGEFGWDEQTFRDAATKASYCLTYLKELVDGGEFETHTSADTGRLEEMFRAVVLRGAGANAVEYVPEQSEFYPWGYIDHQSHEVCAEAFASADTLAAFIFNPASSLTIDNDNH